MKFKTSARKSLQENILELSNSSLWEEAKNEWSVLMQFYSSKARNCPCGQTNVKRCCYLLNDTTGHTLIIGHNCAEHFIAQEEIERCNKDLVTECNNGKILTEWEFNFMNSIISQKMSLTVKQQPYYKKIMSKMFIYKMQKLQEANIGKPIIVVN